MIDTHIHLVHFWFNGEFPYLSLKDGAYQIERGTRDQLIARLLSAGVECCINPAMDILSNRELLALAERMPDFLFVAIGVHPTRSFHYCRLDKHGNRIHYELHWKERKELNRYAEHPSVVAIGETGLDYHIPEEEQHRFCQKRWFLYQLKLAHKKHLPVILHIREAHEDALKMLKRHRKLLCGGVCHCFKGSVETASQYVSLGLKLGIGGSLLQNTPESKQLEQTVAQMPLENFLLETDGPFVKPECPELPDKQFAKARNTSLILPAVAKRIAQLKGISFDEVVRVTSENAVKLFGLPEKNGL